MSGVNSCGDKCSSFDERTLAHGKRVYNYFMVIITNVTYITILVDRGKVVFAKL